MNSVGVLPYQVLDVDEKTKALGMLHNTKQIKEQFNAHENKVKQSRFFVSPYQEGTQGMYSI